MATTMRYYNIQKSHCVLPSKYVTLRLMRMGNRLFFPLSAAGSGPVFPSPSPAPPFARKPETAENRVSKPIG